MGPKYFDEYGLFGLLVVGFVVVVVVVVVFEDVFMLEIVIRLGSGALTLTVCSRRILR